MTQTYMNRIGLTSILKNIFSNSRNLRIVKPEYYAAPLNTSVLQLFNTFAQ